MIYFDINKEAFADEIPDYIATVEDEVWAEYSTTDKWDIIDGEFVDISETPEYQAKKAEERETEFKSKFFEIRPANEVFQGGWYRKKPKGYSSAVESMNSIFNVVSSIGILPQDTLIFYTAPDFSKEEECTEEWLVQHQFKNEEMTATQFGQFYVAFMQAWNTEEHE